MPNTHICCDLNYMAFSEFSLFSNYGKVKNPLQNERDKISFVQSLANRLFYTVNRMPKGGRIVVCIDSRSWRKSIDRQYKESREDEHGNKGIMDKETKEIFYKIIAEFGDVLSKAGICVSKIQGAEGDDLIFKWAKYFNDNGDNCIVVTGDKDLTQIIKGPEDPWTIVWNPKTNANKMYVPRDWLDFLSTKSGNTIFDFSMADDSGNILKIIRDGSIQIETVVPEIYILKKILIGDDGDDVPSVWSVSKSDGKSNRVTDKRADKILEIVFEKFKLTRKTCMIRWNEEEFMDELAGAILRVMGDVDGVEQRLLVRERLQLNAKLVWLHEEQIPFNILEMIDENIKESLDIEVDRSRWNRKAIFEGTRFQHGNAAPKNLDPFRFVDLPEEDS